VSGTKKVTDSYDFDTLEPLAVPVKHGGKRYILRETVGDQSTKWRNAVLRSMTPNGLGGLTPGPGYPDTDLLLLGMCLHEITPGGEQPVGAEELKQWPTRVIKPLFERVKSASGLEAEEDTVENLTTRISDLEKRLTALRQAQEADPGRTPSHAGNGHGGTTDSSA
jgi:hypothetical protein